MTLNPYFSLKVAAFSLKLDEGSKHDPDTTASVFFQIWSLPVSSSPPLMPHLGQLIILSKHAVKNK